MQRVNNGFVTFLLYGLGFLLFWEWLRPLSAITEIGNLSVFVMYAAFTFFLSYLQFPYWITFPVKALAMFYAIHMLFFSGSFFNPGWMAYFIETVTSSVSLMFDGEWNMLPDLFRTFLFFILLWLMSYLMHYWLIQARKVFLFFFVTVLYVTIVDTFTAYDANAAIVRTVVIGFILLGVLRLIKIQEKENVSIRRGRFPAFWITALAMMIVFTSLVGFAAPKIEPQWPDPVPFITSTAEKYNNDDSGVFGSGATKRIGYGTNDSRLGGPFVFDDTPVFKAAREDSAYWRVESKAIYTGKGWKSSNQGELEPLNLNQESAPDLYEQGVRITEANADIELAEGRDFEQLVYGGELEQVNIPNDVRLQMNPLLERIKMVRGGDQISLDQYSIVFQVPEYSIKELKEPGNTSAAIEDRYLQLPDSLPDRVRELTEEITADAENRYDKARAVEDYFSANGFVYDTKNVAVPGENEDYVAQFLFDTLRGYCDNFSSSMAVMLRTIGIPTRWVKGFTPGEYVETLDSGKRVYEVTNANAHSWVEVYFPGEGWVPFEPTKGFYNIFDFVSDYEENESTVDANEQKEDEQEATPASQKPEKPEDNNQAGSGNSLVVNLANPVVWGSALAGLALIAWALYKTRMKWLPRIVLSFYKRKSGGTVFIDAYQRLLWLLKFYGLRRREEETLREYAVHVDQALEMSEMKALTLSYEQARYRGTTDESLWRESKELWENIIKKLSS